MKERFERSILRRLDSFDLTEEQKRQLRQVDQGIMKGSKQKFPAPGSNTNSKRKAMGDAYPAGHVVIKLTDSNGKPESDAKKMRCGGEGEGEGGP